MENQPTTYRKVVYLTFPPESSGKPLVCDLARVHGLCFSILKAQITPRQEGQMTIEITGERDVVALAERCDQAHRQTEGVGGGMDLGGQSASRPTQALGIRPLWHCGCRRLAGVPARQSNRS